LATHKSAKKRARQSLKRRTRNRHVRSRVRGAVRTARQAVDAGNTEELPTTLRSAESVLRRAASKGVIPGRRASRLISRLNRAAAKTS